MEIKVLMLGGYLCGKTSALASMFEQVVYGSLRNVLEMQDRTVCENLDFITFLRHQMAQNEYQPVK